MANVISLSQARMHLRLSARRQPRQADGAALPSSAPLDFADVAQLALLLTRSSEPSPHPRSTDIDAYYGSEQDADRL